jgi:hypothetical protein
MHPIAQRQGARYPVQIAIVPDAIRGYIVSQQKPGFPLNASIEARPNTATLIHITLPGGQRFDVAGPPLTAREIGGLNVMYYPDQFVQILVTKNGNPPQVFPLQIAIADLPPHTGRQLSMN